jgi:signal transduction histidine kinase
VDGLSRARSSGRTRYQRRLDERVDERTRIARELHDTLLQSFHGLLLRFQTASHLLPERPSDAKEKLEHAIQQAVTPDRS